VSTRGIGGGVSAQAGMKKDLSERAGKAVAIGAPLGGRVFRVGEGESGGRRAQPDRKREAVHKRIAYVTIQQKALLSTNDTERARDQNAPLPTKDTRLVYQV